jgi:hypothetical protein
LNIEKTQLYAPALYELALSESAGAFQGVAPLLSHTRWRLLFNRKKKQKMCLYPKLLLNKKYLPTKKNNYHPPILEDERLKYVSVGCGNCEECLKKKSREWQVRLLEEIKNDTTGKFVTLTFTNESLIYLKEKIKFAESNAVAGHAVRLFLERWRKNEKKSIKHWLITELGQNNTERIHLHGIIFTEKDKEFIQKKWSYGNIWVGEYVNEKTINYIIKYLTKIDEKHKGFKPQIFTSAGIGKNYINSYNAKKNKYIADNTKEYYTAPNGTKLNLPIYYRNKIYTEKEREKLWLEKIEKGEIYINGTKISVKNEKEQEKYLQLLKNAQEKNERKGYGNDSKEFNKKYYNISLKKLNKMTKFQKIKAQKLINNKNLTKSDITYYICNEIVSN